MISENAKKSEKLPEPVQLALQALERLKGEDAQKAEDVRKLLPSYAMKLGKEGQEITVDLLLDAARQGAEALIAPRTVTTPQEGMTYQKVIAKLNALKTPEKDSVDEDNNERPNAHYFMQARMLKPVRGDKEFYYQIEDAHGSGSQGDKIIRLAKQGDFKALKEMETGLCNRYLRDFVNIAAVVALREGHMKIIQYFSDNKFIDPVPFRAQ